MLRIRAIILFFLLPLLFFGQKQELNKVTKDELLQKKYPSDTAAAAAFIFKKAKVDFDYDEEIGFTSTTVFQIKLKIYRNEGLKWADFKIPYYIGYKYLDDESVQIISGYTYNLENDKIVKTKVSGTGKFSEKINDSWARKSVVFPNVKVGSIIELEYKFKTQNLWVLPEFQYQYDIPVDFAELKTYIPEYYVYQSMKRGFVDLNLDQKAEYTSKSFKKKAGYANVDASLSYKQITSTYTASHIPALKEEDFVNNINNYYGKLENELQIIRMPEVEPKQIATTWEAVAKSIYDDKDFNTAISKFDYFTNDIKSTINGISSPEERAKKIFSFLKNRMNWNGFYGYYPKQNIETAYAEKVGNIGEINLMLVSMLRMAGIDANPVLVSTRDNGFASFPNKTIFNYVIVAAMIDNKTILMDATDKLSDFDLLPIRTLNWKGRMIKKDGTSTEIDLMPKSNSKQIINAMAAINLQGGISGKIRKQYSDYDALVFREKYNGIAKESYIEKKENESPGLEIKGYDVQNSLDLNLPIIENYDFNLTNSVEVIGDKMYFSPLLFFGIKENPFRQEKREYPVDFMYPYQRKFSFNITIPDGYAIDVIPQSKAVSLPQNMGNFKYNIAGNGRQIQLLYTQDINQAVIEADFYEALKNFYKEILNKQTEKIVLKKA